MTAEFLLSVKRKLGLLPAKQFLARPAPSRCHTGCSIGQRRLDEYHVRTQGVPAGLEQDGRVDHHSPRPAGLSRLGDATLHLRTHRWVQDVLQPPTLLRVGKNPPSQSAAIDGARRVEDLIAPLPPDGLPYARLVQQRMAERVGVDDLATGLAERPGHRALARANTARNPDDCNLAHLGDSALPRRRSQQTADLFVGALPLATV